MLIWLKNCKQSRRKRNQMRAARRCALQTDYQCARLLRAYRDREAKDYPAVFPATVRPVSSGTDSNESLAFLHAERIVYKAPDTTKLEYFGSIGGDAKNKINRSRSDKLEISHTRIDLQAK